MRISVLVGKAKEEVPKVMVLGGEDSPKILEGIGKLDKINIVAAQTNWKDEIINKEMRGGDRNTPGFEADLAAQKSATLVKIYMYEGEMKSSFADGTASECFKDLRDNVYDNAWRPRISRRPS